ncbi:beta-ketoacyl synthase N-terminal-like domain-containing protein [Nodularia sp. UHCC 0506]|nr:beta-ketoacyl synthase N-terminal-like domain-containing protein [Nodularia sp. UHCC 0506]MEA5517173.1 beta-ketoacyl synthase N-terminal-like domain-containing protein [Nodularia sp. UHCC 0506]
MNEIFQTNRRDAESAEVEKKRCSKIAIIGMDCYLGGGCQGLDTFEQSIYEGTQHFIPLPDQRWQSIEKLEKLLRKHGFDNGKAPLGAYIQDWQIPSKSQDKFNLQEILMSQVADNALKDAGIYPGSKVAVIIVKSPELEHLDIENNQANDIFHQWNFTGTALTLNAEKSSVFKALELAQKLLINKEVDAVLVGAVDSASVLLRHQICSVSRVREAIKSEKLVYLTLINTPEEVIISGAAQACARVIENLQCHAYPTPLKHVIHCQPMRSEYNELAKINTLPVKNVKETIFYSAAEYKPMLLDSNSIGNNIAQTLCQELDFPRLVNRVYNDGSKIFIEVGVGSNCSRWISKILQDKEHFTASLNRRGIDDHVSIIRVLAKLLSHRVEMDLSPLYAPSPASSIHNQLSINKTDKKFQRLQESEIFHTSSIHAPEQQVKSLKLKELSKPTYFDSPDWIMSDLIGETVPEILCFDKSHTSYSTLLRDRPIAPQEELLDDPVFIPETENQESLLPNDDIADKFVAKKPQPNLRSPHYQKLIHNASQMTQTHSVLLQVRQESLHQISTIVQQQLKLYQKLFEQPIPEID